MKKSEVIAALGALAQETRLDIFRLLVREGPQGLAGGAIGDRLKQPSPTLSFHLNQLRFAGLGFFPGQMHSSAIIARFNPDGSNDTTFEFDGVVITNFGFVGASIGAVALQADGKIVVSATVFELIAGDSQVIVARFLSNGTLDTSFHHDGIVQPFWGLASSAQSIAIQADNKIVVAGGVGGSFIPGDTFVVRYTPDGNLDRTFGYLGKSIITITGDNGESGGVLTVRIQPDQKIVLSGSLGNYDQSTIFVARLQPRGKMDTSFDGDGVKTISFGAGINLSFDFEIQPDGKIVVGGHHAATEMSAAVWTIARLDANGGFDNSFDGDGKLTIADPGGRQIFSFDLAIQSDGKLVMGGLVSQVKAPATSPNFLIMRRNSDGAPDVAFGTGGTVETDMVPTASDQIRALRIQPDGKIIAAGLADRDFALARYLGQ